MLGGSLVSSLGALEGSWEPLGGSWEPLWEPLGGFWEPLGLIWELWKAPRAIYYGSGRLWVRYFGDLGVS